VCSTSKTAGFTISISITITSPQEGSKKLLVSHTISADATCHPRSGNSSSGSRALEPAS
jgi:hypothetical protein